MNTTPDPVVAALDDPSTSEWLRQALRAALKRDPISAANDAALLADLLLGRTEELLFRREWGPPTPVDGDKRGK